MMPCMPRCSLILSVFTLLFTGCATGDPPSTPSAPVRSEVRVSSATPAPDRTTPDASPRPPAAPTAAPKAPAPPPPPKALAEGRSGLMQALPSVVWRSPDTVESQWSTLSRLAPVPEQFRALDRLGAQHAACRGLVNFRAINAREKAPFGFRDNVRGRSWVRPAVALILIEALAKLREEAIGTVITIGDISQPGCGQLAHGTLVRYVSDAGGPGALWVPEARRVKNPPGPATQLINSARLRWGYPTVWELVSAEDLGAESRRLSFATEPVAIEHRIVAKGVSPGGAGHPPQPFLKVETRRYRPLTLPDRDAVKAMRTMAAQIMRKGRLVSADKVRSWGMADGITTAWRQHWVLNKPRRQLVTFSRQKIQGRRLPTEGLLELHMSRWQRRKPGSYPKRVRWLRGPDGEWHRWRQLYEAGHQTHTGGRDVDLSYVTDDTNLHFARAPGAIDIVKSWRWFEILDETARRHGARIDRILLDPSIRRLFKRRLPKGKRRGGAWELIRMSRGHDAHHHVRFDIPNPSVDARARKRLEELGYRPSAIF